MNVRTKGLTIAGSTIVILAGIAFALSRGVLLQRFSELDRFFLQSDMQRLVRAVQDEIEELDAVTWDWSAWDDTYRFAQDGNATYAAANLVVSSFSIQRLRFLAVLKTDGSVVWAGEYDREGSAIRPVAPEVLDPVKACCLRRALDSDGPVRGILSTGSGWPLILSARAIKTSDNEGPARGVLVMARVLDSAAAQRIARSTGLNVEQMRTDDPALPAEMKLPGASRSAEPIVLQADDRGGRTGYAVLRDLRGEPAAVLRHVCPSRTRSTAEGAIAGFMFMLVLAAVFVAASSFFVMEWLLLRRLALLNAHVAGIDVRHDLRTRVQTTFNDEVTSLAREINHLLDRLEGAMNEQRLLRETLEEQVLERTRALSRSRAELRRLYRHVEKVRETERRAAASRVHDELGQSMTALKMILEGYRTDLAKRGGILDARLAEAVAILDSTTAAVQDIASELRPSVLDHFGLQEALRWYVEKFARRSGIAARLNLEEIPELRPEVASALFRVVQELLTNVARHARARTVYVGLQREGDLVRLEVEDDGVGIQPSAATAAVSFGLSEVRERMEAIGGTVQIEPLTTHGTKVSIVAPVSAAPETGDEDELAGTRSELIHG